MNAAAPDERRRAAVERLFRALTDINAESGRDFATRYGCQFVATYEELCRHPRVDFVDVCTFPDFRLQPLQICAQEKKHVQVQKPIATNLETAQAMIDTARGAGIQLGVVSQHRFDDSTQFVRRALTSGRLGKLLQADAYVKWFRTAAYYSRPIKGSWATEGGGALINQAIHQVDVLLWLVGGIAEVFEDTLEGGNVTLLRAWRNRASRSAQLGDSSEPRVSKTS